MQKFDKKDKIILYELDKNARQPLSKIAKIVRLKRESVLYRLKKYLHEGIIRNYLTVIDAAKLGFTHYKIYIRLHNITEKQENEMIQDICKNPGVSWAASCDGAYSLVFALKAKTVVDLDARLKSINNAYWKFFKEQHITTIIEANHFYRDYLVGRQDTTERKIAWGGNPEAIKLDKTNIEILDRLCENARVSAIELAKHVGLSADTVIQRIKKLEKSGIIRHYMIWPKVSILAGNFLKVLVRLHNLTDERKKQLYTFCLHNPNIVYTVSCLGDWQFEMDIEVEHLEQFRELMRSFSNKFSDIISDYTALSIYEEHKFRFFEKEIESDNPKI